MSTSVRSAAPSASERYGSSFDSRPNLRAYAMTCCGVSASIIFTAGTFLESSSAWRSVTLPSYFPS
jgi:hypothetical protein